MALSLNGTSGISGIDGSAGTPALQGSDTNTGISFGTDTVNINTGGTTRATVDSSGRVLVGTSAARSNFYNSTATSQVQFEGTGGGGSSSQASVALINNSTSAGDSPYLLIGRSKGSTIGSNTVIASGDSVGRVSFQASDGTEFVEAATIESFVDGTPGANDMPGRLVFSVTRDSQASPTEALRIHNNGFTNVFSAGQGFHVGTGQGAGTTYELLIGAYSASGVNSGTSSIKIWSNGNVVNTNNSYGSLSDVKLKENIADATSQWSDIKALQVRKYNFKEGQTHTQIGLIAQEVELVSPGLVTESPDRDEDGNDLGTVTKSVNYSVLYMKAVKALQEAMERIEQLEAKVAALESA